MSVQYKWAKYRFVVQVLLLFKVELFPVNQQLLKLNLKDVFQILYMPNIRQMPNASNWYFIQKWITLVILNLYSTFKAIHGELSMIKLSYAPYTSTWPRSHCIEAMRNFLRPTVTVNIHSELLSVSLWYNPVALLLHNLVAMLLGWGNSTCKTCDLLCQEILVYV